MSDLSGSQLELMLEKNEAKAQELTMTWIDKWKRMDSGNEEQLGGLLADTTETESRTSSRSGQLGAFSSSTTAVCCLPTSGDRNHELVATTVADNNEIVRTKKFSSGFMVESDVPYIVVLNNDTLESDIRVYYIRVGETLLGNDENEANIGTIEFENLFLKLISARFVYQ